MKLREVWRQSWGRLDRKDEASVGQIEASVEDLRQSTLSALRGLR